nr:hypothetical protein [Streptomyces coryli]
MREEWRRLAGGLREAWRTGGGLRGMWLGAVCAALVLMFSYGQQSESGADFIERAAVVRPSLPLPTALARTPLSMFVPAPDLPSWGAVLQVLVAFGLGGLALGGWRTLAVALVATLAGTLYARLGVWLGPDVPGGLAASVAHERDTGPSAAVVGIAMVLAWRWRSRLLLVLVPGLMLLELIVEPNLAAKEHLVGIAAALVFAAADERLRRRRGRAGRGERSGAP